ncbi:chromate transporter [Marinisporobacter balticus]|uniref:Chromate transporter n=1 Tax=Marinisporobacter balticus TaxID=2018667 RepID=A0A4R2KBB3_9FIRM|nr:chromate transporter [Marinisporobacter balticus]TCO69337.1 chromate transporter [Marinisporobacter balticus]
MNQMVKMFLIFIKIGTFTLGGGYAMIPLIQEEIVEKNKWIEEEEFIDSIALAQSIPGALAINSSTYIGYRLFGLKGALLGCLGAMMPSVIIILIVATFFTKFQNMTWIESMFKGIRPAVVALIVASVMKLGKSLPKSFLNIAWVIGTVLGIVLFHIHPILIIIFSGLLGYKLFKGEKFDENNS